MLLKSNHLVFVTNPKILYQKGRKLLRVPLNSNIICNGNPKFYASSNSKVKDAIPSLASAEKEIADIIATLNNLGKNAVHMIGENVTEDTIRALQNPSVFHISTHGYFMERKAGGSEMLSNPMLDSGLLLSGSGDILASQNGGYINREPGVLTASEVMDLNFSKTNLVCSAPAKRVGSSWRRYLWFAKSIFGGWS